MVQPPSKQLQQILLGRKLCTPRDLKRCVRRVKRLSADLPAFDSVWLDALVQTRRLTSFQAHTIETGLTELLTIGPGIVLDQIGSGPGAATYLVRIPESQIPAAIKRIPVATELKAATLARFRELAQRAGSVGHSAVVVPHACHEIARSTESRCTPAESKKGVSPNRRRRKADSSNDLIGELAVASRLVDGLTLTQMLLRRGRFPASVVQEIARQLLESLAALDAAGIVHGEILTGNVIVDRNGRAVLVDAGVRPCVQPEFSFSATIDPQRYSGIAPELIGTALPYSHRSDLYALGCLLWELLTARPVFPTGDPLARLAEHQTTRIPDVREIAPDTSDALAEAILWLTEPDSAMRPRSAAEVLGRGSAATRTSGTESVSADQQGGSTAIRAATQNSTAKQNNAPGSPTGSAASRHRALPSRTSRRSLTTFSAGFRSRPIARSTRPRSNVRFAGHIAVACLAVVIASAALLTLHGQSRDWVTAAILASRGEESPQVTPTDDTVVALRPETQTSASPLITAGQLPRPDAYGLIELPDAGPWQAESILWSGQRLALRGTGQTPAVLQIDRPIRLRASEIAIHNVEIVFVPPAATTEPIASVSTAGHSQPASPERPPAVSPGLRFESQSLTISDTAVLSHEGLTDKAGPRDFAETGVRAKPASETPFAFIWTPFNPRDSLPGEINIRDTRLVGDRSSIGLGGSRHLVNCRNVLQSGPESLFVIAQSKNPGRHDFQMQHCTLRESGGLLEVRLDDGNAWRSQVRIQPVGCVFDLAAHGPASAAALVRFRADTLTPTWHETLIIDGSDSIARPDLRVVQGVSRDSRHHTELDASNVTLNGLIGATFDFQSPAMGHSFTASVLKSHDASLGSTVRPGIDDLTGDRTAAVTPGPPPASGQPILRSEATR